MINDNSVNKLVDKYIRFEFEKGLFNKRINEIEYWQFIRFNLFYELLYQRGVINKRPGSESNFQKIIESIKSSVKYSFVKNPIHNLCEKDSIVLNHQRRILYRSIYYEIYTDPVLKNLDFSFYVFESPDKKIHYSPVNTNNLKYIDFFINLKHLKKPFSKNVLSKKNIDEIKHISQMINENFNIEIYDFIQNKIVDLTVFIELFEPYFHKIIHRVDPKIVLEVVHYSFFNMVFNFLIRKHEYNIPIVELQHGTMGRYHWGYNYYKKPNLDIFPDYIFLWGDFWKKNTRFPIKDDKLIVTGFPYFEERKNKIEKKEKKVNKKVILFISQWAIGDKLSKLASKLYNKIDKEKYHIIYKLHPGEYDIWKDKYPWLKIEGLDVIDNNKHDIYYYFKQADIQVGVNSTALIEGLGFNLKTFICKEFGHEYFEELYNNGYAHLVKTADGILEKISSIEENKNIGLDFWKKDSLNNIKKNLELIMKKH